VQAPANTEACVDIRGKYKANWIKQVNLCQRTTF
jgi:hypothetical protein